MSYDDEVTMARNEERADNTPTPEALAEEIVRAYIYWQNPSQAHITERETALMGAIIGALTEQAREIERLKKERFDLIQAATLDVADAKRATWEAAKGLMLAEASYTSQEGDRSWLAEVDQFARYVAELFDARAAAQGTTP